MLDTPCSEVVWRVLATHSIRQFPLHFPYRASPCAITFQLSSNTHDGLSWKELIGCKHRAWYCYCIVVVIAIVIVHCYMFSWSIYFHSVIVFCILDLLTGRVFPLLATIADVTELGGPNDRWWFKVRAPGLISSAFPFWVRPRGLTILWNFCPFLKILWTNRK